MLHEFPNFLPGFYGGGPAGKVFGAGVAGATALKT